MMQAVHLAAGLLADASDGTTGGENDKSGPIGLAVILLLIVACAFLFKSMSKHLRKVREGFPADPAAKSVESGSATAAPASKVSATAPTAKPKRAVAPRPDQRDS